MQKHVFSCCGADLRVGDSTKTPEWSSVTRAQDDTQHCNSDTQYCKPLRAFVYQQCYRVPLRLLTGRNAKGARQRQNNIAVP